MSDLDAKIKNLEKIQKERDLKQKEEEELERMKQ
jgi:hypothetical protein